MEVLIGIGIGVYFIIAAILATVLIVSTSARQERATVLEVLAFIVVSLFWPILVSFFLFDVIRDWFRRKR